MAKYRKKPVVIDAFKWTAGPDQTEDPEWIVEAMKKKGSEVGYAQIVTRGGVLQMFIKALEGTMKADVGDYIIRGVEGEIYPCRADIFAKTYEAVDDAPQMSGS